MRSSTWRRVALLALAAAGTAGAQSLAVYSGLSRIDPFGEVVDADRGENAPREILSPALPRNATSGYHLVVTGPPGAAYTLFVGQNPDNAVGVTMYREKYVKVKGKWVPDALERVKLPYPGKIGADEIPGQTTQSYWMDLRVSRDAPAERIKIEPQASFADRWAIYPMEARIVVATAPDNLKPPSISVPSPDQPADYAARRVLKQKVCGNSEKVAAGSALTIRDMIARDAVQDVAMASVVPLDVLWELIGAPDHAKWCQAEAPHPSGPEWYLRIRDRVVGSRH